MRLYRHRVRGSHRHVVLRAIYNRSDPSEVVPTIDGTEMCVFKYVRATRWTIGPIADSPWNKHLDIDGGPRLRLAVAKLHLLKDS